MHLSCQNDQFARDQQVAGIACLQTGTLKGDSVAAARHFLAYWNLSGGLIGISAVATARHISMTSGRASLHPPDTVLVI
jgi:hypothetical protein